MTQSLMSIGWMLLALVLSASIGLERQIRGKSAGIRTQAIVGLTACLMMLISKYGFSDILVDGITRYDPSRVASQIVSGIGFLGAGVIMKEGMNVRGLNTAATLWCSAAVGACTGADMIAEGALLTAFVIAGNTLLRPLVNAINRVPIDERVSEATYEVRLSAVPDTAPAAREWLVDHLEAANYPVGDVNVDEHGDTATDIVATLVSTAVVAAELDAVVERLRRLPGVTHATWESSTRD